MRQRVLTSAIMTSAVAAVVAALGVSAPPASAQTAAARTKRAAPPARLADGRPDLQGEWSFATVTPLERPKEYADRATLTAEEAAKIEERAVRDQFVDRPPPPGNPGAYNRFWIDVGTEVVSTNRTSLVIDPPDGRVPALTPEGMAREEARAATRTIAAGPEDLPMEHSSGWTGWPVRPDSENAAT